MARKSAFVGFLAVAVIVATAACAAHTMPTAQPAASAAPEATRAGQPVVGPLSQDEARALATMNGRLREYVELHLKFERALPMMSVNSNSEQIDRNRSELRRLLGQARASAKPGDVFTPEARPVILRLLARVFDGPQGTQTRASIADDDQLPRHVLIVNAPYPEGLPVTSVPPDILKTLPQLTEGLEYRFVGSALILLDSHAHMIVDYVANAIPRSRQVVRPAPIFQTPG